MYLLLLETNHNKIWLYTYVVWKDVILGNAVELFDSHGVHTGTGAT